MHLQELVGKGENAGYHNFLHFPQSFLTAISSVFLNFCSETLNIFFPGCSLILSQTTNFRLFQIERVSRRQFQVLLKWQKVPQRGRKHYGKRRNCALRAISPFPTVISKDLHSRHVKTKVCLGKH